MRAFVVVLAAALAACSGMSRPGATTGRAVVVYEPKRESDASVATGLMRERGWDVELAASGPARRTRSSFALYGQRHAAAVGAELVDVLRPLIGDIDVLPFLGAGPGENDAVLWLSEAKARAAPAESK